MQSIIWRHFHIDIPDDWEMLLFSSRRSAGQCYFADRYQHRMVFRWQIVTAEPDLERMSEDYASLLQEADEVHSVKQTAFNQWRGAIGIMDDATHASWAAYFSNEACLIEITFLTPGTRDARLEERILRSIREEAVVAGDYRRWRAFGMEILADDRLWLQRCTAQPANAQLLFAKEDVPLREEKFERMGMVSEWLLGSVADWLRKRTPSGVRIRQQSRTEVYEHEFHLVVGDRPVAGAWRLLGRRMPYVARAWICPTDGRLYCATLIGERASDEQPPLHNRLRCCDFAGRSDG